MSIDERRTRKQNHIMEPLRNNNHTFADIQNNIEK